MARVFCPLGHAYDSNQFSSCPICQPGGGGMGETQAFTPNGAMGGNVGETQSFTPNGGVGATQAFTPGGTTPMGAGAPSMPWTPGAATVSLGKNGASPTPQGFGATAPVGGGATIRMSSKGGSAKEEKIAPVVGWFVCIEGIERGKDYRLCAGGNTIGRIGGNITPDVILKDEQVSRGAHATLFYDPEDDNYVLQSGQVHGLTKVNGVLLTGAITLNYHDKIKMGSSIFLFEPLCREGFSWKE
ncbi:MAG: hypothetical protein Q4C78_01595 [Synergistaceae bacterium]|nr:hypothetical protein [Synergistaceae bacterium]